MSGEGGAATPGSVTGLSTSNSVASIPVDNAARKRRLPPKIQRVAWALLDGPKTSRQLEAAPVFDHVAHSTLAELRSKGVEVVTEMVEVPGYAGLPVRVARYSLTDAGRRRVVELFGYRHEAGR